MGIGSLLGLWNSIGVASLNDVFGNEKPIESFDTTLPIDQGKPRLNHGEAEDLTWKTIMRVHAFAPFPAATDDSRFRSDFSLTHG
jgi:hypothetical protein